MTKGKERRKPGEAYYTSHIFLYVCYFSNQVRRVKALRSVSKRPRDEQQEGDSDGGGAGDAASGDGGGESDGGERVATAAAKAKRGTRRKNKERKIL